MDFYVSQNIHVYNSLRKVFCVILFLDVYYVIYVTKIRYQVLKQIKIGGGGKKYNLIDSAKLFVLLAVIKKEKFT